MAILGIDIAAGGFFAYAVLEGKSIVEKGVLNARELAHLFKRYRIEILATDNIGELFEYGRPVVRLLGKLPYTVEVVEVTRGAGGYRKMEEAREGAPQCG
jgi:Uncharacterized conserved protein